MAFIRAADAVVFSLPGITFTGLASPCRGSNENAVWLIRLDPGAPPVPHRVTREEIFVALSGVAEAIVGDSRHKLEPGCALVVPADVEFALSNPGELPFEAVVVMPVGGCAVVGEQAPFVPPWAA